MRIQRVVLGVGIAAAGLVSMLLATAPPAAADMPPWPPPRPEPPNLTGQPIFGPGTHTVAEWFNPKAFSTPPAFTFGDVGRNTVIGPGLQTIDLALAREFSLVERMKFQFRAEFFNALNQVNLGTPDRFVSTPQVGTITEAATPGRQIKGNFAG